MKIQEAIKEIKSYADNSWGDLNEAFEMAINALEKQVPKRPIEDGYYDEPAVCPNCGESIIKLLDNNYPIQYCLCCGQALDFTDYPTEKGGDEE
jgi:hypothetical protein